MTGTLDTLDYVRTVPTDLMPYYNPAMQELLSKTRDLYIPLRDQDYYELRLFQKTNPLGTRHCVQQTHAQWSELDRDVMFEGEEVEYFWILDEAKRRYAERRLSLNEKGFIYSDMDW